MSIINLNLPDKKTTSFLLLGIVLYLGSSYLNTLKPHSADLGIIASFVIIGFSFGAQCLNWLNFWTKEGLIK